uniref:Uncharacterized protein n=1 Tax=Octactis speculum TaxID=3111310 RepID=A0A7S2B8L4_9STRA|mmetsp:Transcript_20733/g.28200  ORF Transcript_20733/g.28200 Transcript_20733/m.28200 type:complete len:145 (+) Transcript_20733:142-576(+)
MDWLMFILVSTEPGVASYFRRNFIWHDCVASPEDFFAKQELPVSQLEREADDCGDDDDAHDPVRSVTKKQSSSSASSHDVIQVMIALSENDELAHAPTVRTFLQRSSLWGRDTTTFLWWPKTSHTQFMMYPSCWRDISTWIDAQ